MYHQNLQAWQIMPQSRCDNGNGNIRILAPVDGTVVGAVVGECMLKGVWNGWGGRYLVVVFVESC